MIVSPAIISLMACLVIVSFLSIYASFSGMQICFGWNPAGASEKQVLLEKKTHLVSALFNFVLSCEILSLFLFVYTADRLHPLFVGAMCAAGTLNVGDYGYLTLGLKMFNVIAAGIWIIVNHLDIRGYDYPLIREKYAAVPFIACLLISETILLFLYWVNLEPQIITSCCGTIFNEDEPTLAGGISHLSPKIMIAVFFLHTALTLAAGCFFLYSGKGAKVFSLLGSLLFLTGIASVISFVSSYYYQLPTHHCPFCLLQREYTFIGYPIYAALFAGGIAGAGVGVIDLFKKRRSIRHIIPVMQKKLCITSVLAFFIFLLITLYPMVFTDYRL